MKTGQIIVFNSFVQRKCVDYALELSCSLLRTSFTENVLYFIHG